MNSGRGEFSRGVIGYPTILLTVAWVAIWLLWPQVTVPSRQTGRLPEGRVAVTRLGSEDLIAHKRPTLFARSEATEFDAFAEIDPAMASVSRLRRPTQPRFLEQDAEGAGATSPAAVPVSARQPSLTGWDVQRFPLDTVPVPQREWKLLVEPSAGLKECGFRVPDSMRAKLEETARPALVVARVEVNAGGRVSHVFLEQRSDDPALNRTVLGALERGIIDVSGTPCRGRVAVSFVR